MEVSGAAEDELLEAEAIHLSAVNGTRDSVKNNPQDKWEAETVTSSSSA